MKCVITLGILPTLGTPLIEYPYALQPKEAQAEPRLFEKFKKRPLKKLVEFNLKFAFAYSTLDAFWAVFMPYLSKLLLKFALVHNV